MRYFKNLKFTQLYENSTIPMDKVVFLTRELDGTEHNYNLHIRNSQRGGYNLEVYLSLTAPQSNDILVYRDNYEYEEDAKQDACRVINELERTELREDIEEWKECKVHPVFDKDCNLLGDVYTTIPILKNNAENYDYYNSTPLNEYHGNFYILDDKNSYREETVGINEYISKKRANKTILKKLLKKLTNKRKYCRFFE